MKKKVTFIINPISGGKTKHKIPSMIENIIDHRKFETVIQFTQSAEHNQELAQQAVESGTDILVAVGGDGTINHIAKYVARSKTSLAIVPRGSGNGLARHMKIPMEPAKALALINQEKTIQIDTGMANSHFFINVAGVGFDAHVSWLFSKAPKRGFITYTQITLKEFANYKPEHFELIIDGKTLHKDAFILAVANGSQWGNNAYIAPTADLTDGVFEVNIMKPFKPVYLPVIGAQLFMKQFNRSVHVDNYSGKEIVIHRKAAGILNIDGEPVHMDKSIHLKMHPKSLNIIVP